jgi:hypothetical protein
MEVEVLTCFPAAFRALGFSGWRGNQAGQCQEVCNASCGSPVVGNRFLEHNDGCQYVSGVLQDTAPHLPRPVKLQEIRAGKAIS